jgi:adenine-specific DNA-methyltransferase
MGQEAEEVGIAETYQPEAAVVLYLGDCLELLPTLPAGAARLIVTSPPYNLGKSYERRRPLAAYLEQQARVIAACERVLAEDGSICWQVGNHVDEGELFPLDVLLYPLFKRHALALRNRIVWHFEHGLHCARRFSGRYETILWFTRERYVFDLDPVRVPQKYPGKRHYKGPRAGQYSCHPLGKNPGDVWTIPNVKHNHVEKTIHPCQFPVELVERLVLSMTHPGDWVLDPYMGVGTTLAAAVRHGRRGMGADTVEEYVEVARQRVLAAHHGTLRTRPMDRPVYEPTGRERVTRRPGSGCLKEREGLGVDLGRALALAAADEVQAHEQATATHVAHNLVAVPEGEQPHSSPVRPRPV